MQTLYNDYTDYLMDMRVLCSVLAEPTVPYEELKQSYFKEFAEFKPRPTLEAKRYEISRKVSDDYKIEYEKQVELRANEKFVDLEKSESGKHLVSSNDVDAIAPAVKEVFLYEHSITDMIREEIMSKYDLTTGEEFTLDVETVENLQGNTEEDKSLWLTEEEVEDIDNYDSDEVAEQEVEYTPEYGVSDESDDYEDEYDSYDEEDEELEEEDTDYTYEEEYSEEEEYEEDTDYSDDYGDDYSEDEDDYSEYTDEEEEFEEESEEEYLEEDEDYSDYTEEDEDDEYDSYDEEEEVEEIEEEKPNEVVQEVRQEVKEPDSFIPDLSDIDDDMDLVFEEVVEKSEPQEVLTPVVVNNDSQGYVLKPDAHKEVEKPKEEEPTDLRQFIKKHPRCDYNFALQYFTKKQINDAIKIGKVVKRGNILKL